MSDWKAGGYYLQKPEEDTYSLILKLQAVMRCSMYLLGTWLGSSVIASCALSWGAISSGTKFSTHVRASHGSMGGEMKSFWPLQVTKGTFPHFAFGVIVFADNAFIGTWRRSFLSCFPLSSHEHALSLPWAPGPVPDANWWRHRPRRLLAGHEQGILKAWGVTCGVCSCCWLSRHCAVPGTQQ